MFVHLCVLWSSDFDLCVQMHARREESYMQLQAHRHKMREDQHHLTEHEREHMRLQRIGTRSEVGPELYA